MPHTLHGEPGFTDGPIVASGMVNPVEKGKKPGTEDPDFHAGLKTF